MEAVMFYDLELVVVMSAVSTWPKFSIFSCVARPTLREPYARNADVETGASPICIATIIIRTCKLKNSVAPDEWYL